MPMIDSQVVLDTITGVAITSSRDSTNILDLGVQRDIGVGWEVELHVVCITAFDNGATPTLQASVQVAQTVGGTYYDIVMSPVYTGSSLVAGKHIMRYNLPPLNQLNYAGTVPSPRFLKLHYTVASGPFTVGTVAAWLAGHFDRDSFVAYPANYVTV